MSPSPFLLYIESLSIFNQADASKLLYFGRLEILTKCFYLFEIQHFFQFFVRLFFDPCDGFKSLLYFLNRCCAYARYICQLGYRSLTTALIPVKNDAKAMRFIAQMFDNF